MATHPHFGEAKQKLKSKKVMNVMVEIKATSLDRYLIVISTLLNY